MQRTAIEGAFAPDKALAGRKALDELGTNLAEFKAKLDEANLSGAKLVGTNLTEANLYRADLRGADLTRAILTFSDMEDALLEGAIFCETVMSNGSVNNQDC